MPWHLLKGPAVDVVRDKAPELGQESANHKEKEPASESEAAMGH